MQVGGNTALTEEQKQFVKQIRDEESAKYLPAASKNSSIVPSISPTPPVTTISTSGKKVIRLDNDYYEVDVDSKGAPIFTKDMSNSKLSAAKKQEYSNKYYFNESPTVTNIPVLDASTAVTTVSKVTNTGNANETKLPVKKAVQKPKPKGSAEVMALQTELNKSYGTNIPVDGFIGNQTREAFYAAELSDEAREKYLNANPELNKAATVGTPAYLALLSTGTQTTPAKPKTIAKQDSTKTATDSSFINKMFKDTLGVTIDTAKLQKPAPKKVITPPSMNKGTDTNGGIIQAQRQVEEGVKRGIKPRGLTGYEKIDRFQDDVSALSTAASLTGVGGLPAKVVDIADAALDAGQFAYAYATGNKPEMLNQGIQTGMRVVLPLAARGAGKAIQKYSPAAEEIGYRIGKSKVGEKIIAPIFNKNSMSKYNTVGVQVIDDMQKVPGYMSRIDNDVVEAGKAAKIFMKKVNKKTNPAEVAQAKSALKRYEDALLASNKKDITEMEAMRREMAGQKFNKDAASKQATYKQASAVKSVEEAKIPKLKTDGLGTEWKWQGEDTAKLIAEQEALLAKAITLPEVKRINEQLKKLYSSKVIHLKPIKVPSVKKQLGGYYFM